LFPDSSWCRSDAFGIKRQQAAWLCDANHGSI
jgi:hypothetical protein